MKEVHHGKFIDIAYYSNKRLRMRTFFKLTSMLLLLLGMLLILFRINTHFPFMRSEMFNNKHLGEFITEGQIDQAVKFKRIIVPKLINPRKSIDHSLQQLINISLKTFEECPDGRYSRYLRVLIQREWETNVTDEEQLNNSSDIPLIIYGTQNAVYRKLSSSGCRYMCEYSTNQSDFERATLAVYTKYWGKEFLNSSGKKMWAFETNESPIHIHMPETSLESKFSIFVTYDTDSLVPWLYGLFFPYGKPHCLIPQTTREIMADEDSKQFLPAHHKLRKKLAAWVVTNRAASRREWKFAELSKLIKIDRYGHNGIPCRQGQTCFEDLSREYKFLITFENSNCDEYITEKLFKNALRNEMVPIVFGARSDDYYELAPPNSYIDESSFPSLEKLVSYLQWLDSNDTAYASYFAWKKYGYLADRSKLNCRLCGVLHNILNGRLDSQKNEFNRFTDKKTHCLL